jgi:thermostable 8-oxoguanine DNA glycosylase
MFEPAIAVSFETEAIRATVRGVQGDPLGRRKWNVDGMLSPTPPETFWEWLTRSLLSSRQSSRKGSANWRLENGIDPFPLPFEGFSFLDESKINERLKRFRFNQRIAKQLLANYDWLFSAGNGWSTTVQPLLEQLLDQRNSEPKAAHKELERTAANILVRSLQGIGPKQARNLLQSLGLTRYEIPLDSRVVAWLQVRLGWNIVMEALSRAHYYEDLLDRVQASCESAGVLPALFDAAVFDKMERTKPMKPTPTTCTGYVNRNGQVVIRNTGTPGTDNNQYVYHLACSNCGHAYGANGSDIHLRLCPKCQSGAAGLKYE